ncbi:hypothetical protein [Bradyrhizobium sp. McL0615]|uniref:nSTAND1 domain-containing NTPase n=1 Tax=Bradyrhizobium sp. McL0615 TaxID=3415673 RepID=UPI003CE6BDC2
MSTNGEIKVIRLFVSSPSDVAPERGRVQAVTSKLNAEYRRIAQFETILWEDNFYKADATFQAQIEGPNACDVVVSIFWSRLGTELPVAFGQMPNGASYPSGTVYELLTALQASRQTGIPDVYVFRKTSDLALPAADSARRRVAQAQLDALEAFWSEWFESETGEFRAAFQTFGTADDFEIKLEKLLRQWLANHNVRDNWLAWPPEKGSPFRGLSPFEAEHSAVFFGRERVIDEGRRRLVAAYEHGAPFLLIVGASGAGKSSLARAGLIPRLVIPGIVPGIGFWRIARLKPSEMGARPIAALASSLFSADALPELRNGDFNTPDLLASHFRHARTMIAQPLLRALERAEEGELRKRSSENRQKGALILLVDQLEELFARTVDEEERAIFACCLAELVESRSVWCIATLRADVYEAILREPALKKLKDAGSTFDLEPPGATELVDVIRQPAKAAGLAFEVDPKGIGLDERLITEAKGTDSLPLLQFTLQLLYERGIRSNHIVQLTHSEYEVLGGLSGAIAKVAEKAVSDLSPRIQVSLPRLMRRLVEPGRDATAFTLREVLKAEISSDSSEEALLEALIDARIVTARFDATGRPTVRLAHDAVIASWPRASDAVVKNREFFRIRAEVESSFRRWNQQGRIKARLISSELELAEANVLVKNFGAELTSDVRLFIDQSNSAATAAARVRRALVSVVVLILLGLSGTALGALWVAQGQRDSALTSQSLFLARDSLAANSDGDSTLGILLALEALPKKASSPNRPLLAQAMAALRRAISNERETIVLQEHTQDVLTSAFSPDGTRIVTGSKDDTARIWRTADGKLLSELVGHKKPVTGAAFSPDGKLLLTSSEDGTVRIWSGESGKLLWILDDQGDRPFYNRITTAKFSPDSHFVALTGFDSFISIWDARTGRKTVTLEGLVSRRRGIDNILSLTFSADGSHLAAGSLRSVAGVYDTKTGSLVARLGKDLNNTQPSLGAVTSIAFFPDDSRVVAGHERGEVEVWDWIGKPEIERDEFAKAHNGSVVAIAFSPNGDSALTASYDGTMALWDVDRASRTLKPPSVSRPHTNKVTAAKFSPNGDLILTASADGTVKVWKKWDLSKEFYKLAPFHRPVTTAEFSPDGNFVLASSSDGTSRVWRLESVDRRVIGDLPKSTIRFAGFLPGTDRVNTVSLDGRSTIWDMSGTRITWKTSRGANLGATSADGKWIATGSSRGEIELFDVSSGGSRRLLGHKRQINTLQFSPDGLTLLSGSDDGTLRIWDLNSKVSLRTYDANAGPVRTAEFSSDGKKVLSLSDDGVARLWDVTTGSALTSLKGKDPIVQARIAPTGHLVATVSQEGGVTLWSAATAQVLLTWPSNKSGTRSVAFAPDEGTIASGEASGELQTWNVKSGSLLWTVHAHNSGITDVSYSSDGKAISTASDDGTAAVWNAVSGAEVARLRGHGATVEKAEFSSDGSRILTLSADNTVRLWTLSKATEPTVIRSSEESDNSFVIGPTSKWFARWSPRRQTAELFSMTSGKLIATLAGHSGPITSLSVSDDGRRILTTSGDRTARVWDAGTGVVISVFRGHHGVVRSGTFSRSGTQIATKSDDGTVQTWLADTGTQILTMANSNRYVEPLFAPDARSILMLSATGAPELRDSGTGQLIDTLESDEDVMFASFLSDTKVLVSFKDRLLVWERGSHSPVAELNIENGELRHVYIAPDKSRIVAAFDGRAILWDPATGEKIATLSGSGDYTFAFSADSEMIASTGDDKSEEWNAQQKDELRVWKARDGSLIATFPGASANSIMNSGDAFQQGELRGNVVFSRDSRFVFSAKYYSAEVIDLKSKLVVAELKTQDEFHSAAFLEDSSGLWTTSGNGRMAIWSLPACDAAIQRGQEIVPRALSDFEREKFFLTEHRASMLEAAYSSVRPFVEWASPARSECR